MIVLLWTVLPQRSVYQEEYHGKTRQTLRSQWGKGHGALIWVISILMILSGVLAPIGALFIVLKILGNTKAALTRDPRARAGARTVSMNCAPAAGAAQNRSAVLDQLDRTGRRFTLVGGVVCASTALVCVTGLKDALYWLLDGHADWFADDLLDLIPTFCVTVGFGAVLWVGLRRRRQARVFRQYLNMIGDQSSVTIASLSSATGARSEKVHAVLEDMLERGFFPAGYLDYGGGRLVLTGGGLADIPPAPKASHETPSEEEDFLAQICQVNEEIENKALSAKIDRIGLITARIFDYQRSHPQQSGQLHRFLDYYLPTTLKLLRSYARLEAQEVSGSNITGSMARIEGTMDKVVEGFEKQLDQLFRVDAMDISADVEVLEQMMAADGLSQDEGIRLDL